MSARRRREVNARGGTRAVIDAPVVLTSEIWPPAFWMALYAGRERAANRRAAGTSSETARVRRIPCRRANWWVSRVDVARSATRCVNAAPKRDPGTLSRNVTETRLPRWPAAEL